MKKSTILHYSLFLVLLLAVISGCQQQPILPYLQAISPSQDLMSYDGEYELKFFVVNPTVNTFVGNVTYKFDKECLRLQGATTNIWGELIAVDDVRVLPKDQLGYTKIFTFPSVDKYGRIVDARGNVVETSSCLQRPLQITVSLYDAGGGFRGSQDFSVTITK